MKSIAIFSLLFAGIIAGAHLYESRPSHRNTAHLQQLYADYNNFYFDGKLPQNVPITWADIPMENGDYVMGKTHEIEETRDFSIELDTKSNITESTTALSLFHEMCHVATGDYEREHNEDYHGPRFQACMLRGAENGALKGLW